MTWESLVALWWHLFKSRWNSMMLSIDTQSQQFHSGYILWIKNVHGIYIKVWNCKLCGVFLKWEAKYIYLVYFILDMWIFQKYVGLFCFRKLGVILNFAAFIFVFVWSTHSFQKYVVLISFAVLTEDYEDWDSCNLCIKLCFLPPTHHNLSSLQRLSSKCCTWK